MSALLEVKDLKVSVEGKQLLGGVSFAVEAGETVALFGPNGAGKSSLLFALMGFPRYRVEGGSIVFKGKDITGLPVNERARLGLGVSFQHPPRLRGIRLADMLRLLGGEGEERQRELARQVNMEGFLGRDVNLGFSGGEMKRSEILQLMVQQPDLALLDEPDSGVDLENIELLGREIEALVKDRGALLITHQGHILNYVSADRAMVLFEGVIGCQGKPAKILQDIKEKGYAGCVSCPECQTN